MLLQLLRNEQLLDWFTGTLTVLHAAAQNLRMQGQFTVQLHCPLSFCMLVLHCMLLLS